MTPISDPVVRVSDSLTPLPSSSRQQGGTAIEETVEIEALVDDSGNYTAAYYDSIASEVGEGIYGQDHFSTVDNRR